MKRHGALLMLAVALGTALLRCSNAPSLAGNTSSETTNGFTAAVVYPGGTPAAHAVVRLRERDYLADTNFAAAKSLDSRFDVLTDDSGRFTVDSLEPGDYLIEAADANGNAVAIPCAVGGDSVLDLGVHALSPMGTIAGSAGGPTVQAFARIRGLERCARTDRAGRFVVSVPAGQVYSVSLATSDTMVDLPPTQPVPPSQTVTVTADLGTYRSDSLAVRIFLDSSGLQTTTVDAVSSVDTALRRITALHLERRNLSAIHQSIGKLTFLYELSVAGNPLLDLPSTLADLPHLYHLFLDSLPLTKLPDCVPRILSLRLLEIDYTRILTLPVALSNCTALNVLSMRGTGATEFPAVVTSMPQMAALNISDNPISVLPSSISACINLNHFEMHDTWIDSLPSSLGELQKLREIYAYRCRLTSLPASIGMLTTLEVLNVGHNRLAFLPQELGACRSLEILDIDNNALTALPDSIVNLHPSTSLLVTANKLCTLSAAITAWLDTYAEPTWRAGQICP